MYEIISRKSLINVKNINNWLAQFLAINFFSIRVFILFFFLLRTAFSNFSVDAAVSFVVPILYVSCITKVLVESHY
ncbi:hypothetical protein RhiirC2_858100 [Rhizophagus irregularis]|uniref:Uncharacterized protein n=1 Tax=Rhizophagus irregularis TaxID=588596 RepID=A0A2N1M7Y4_9GLOM|nr:hypothetical protein RhiirC2_858100 [Rhizophagus irregularis]